VTEVFGGDRAAFDAASPASLLAAHAGAYAGHVAVFTHGGQDAQFGPGQVKNAQRAQAAGFTVLTETSPGGGAYRARSPEGARLRDRRPGASPRPRGARRRLMPATREGGPRKPGARLHRVRLRT